MYQGIEENYLYLKIISVVEMLIAKKPLKSKITERQKGGRSVLSVQ